MFSSKAYKTVTVVGVSTCALYACKDNIKKNFGNVWLNAAVSEPYRDFCKPYQPVWDDNWDKRELTLKQKEDGAAKPTATRHIILIRHGQYNLDGETDEKRVLTPLGKEQAHLTALRLKELDIGISTIYESTMTRAKETSSIIQKVFPNVEVKASDLLREGAPIAPVPSHPTWVPAPKDFHADGPRIEAAFRKFVHRASPKQERDSVEVFVCHANVVRYIVCRALQFPAEGWLRLGLRHCSITWITVRPNGKVSLRCLGDSGHFPPDKLTFN